MWKTLYQSVRGTSHQAHDLPCQDSCAARLVELPSDQVLVLACSDGAGSAEHSDVGSRLACDKLIELVVDGLQSQDTLGAVSYEQACQWLRGVHEALQSEAELRSLPARQLACTLLWAVLGQNGAAFGQVGDGAIVVWHDAQYQNIFWPQSGEYANTTNFITDPRCESYLEFAWRDAALDEVALLTDGLQMLGLDFRQRQAHGPFFAPMFEALRRHERPEELIEPMRAFLDSRQVAERTDDDKTLVLATRVAG